MAYKEEKIGRPIIKDPDSGAKIELGHPLLNKKFEKESTQATLFVIKEALEEFYRRRFELGEKEEGRDFQYLHNPMDPLLTSEKEIKKEAGDLTIPLIILEAARGEVQSEFDFLDYIEPDAEDQVTEEKIETTRQADFEKEKHYQEAADTLFSSANYETPTHDDLIEFLRETKEIIRRIATEKVEGYYSAKNRDIVKKVFRSQVLTNVPAIERYETNHHVTDDYREIMEVINSRLLSSRNTIGDLFLKYVNNPQEKFITEMKRLLAETRKMELFLSQLEGERNERIAKKR